MDKCWEGRSICWVDGKVKTILENYKIMGHKIMHHKIMRQIEGRKLLKRVEKYLINIIFLDLND
jgi:hypothetical protein